MLFYNQEHQGPGRFSVCCWGGGDMSFTLSPEPRTTRWVDLDSCLTLEPRSTCLVVFGSPSSRWVYPKWLRFNGWKDRFPPGLGAKNDLLGRSGLSFWLYPLELPFLDRYTYHAWVASPLTQQFGKKHVCRASPPWICPCPKWAIKICILIKFRTMSSYY